jgi:hypothetical protein
VPKEFKSHSLNPADLDALRGCLDLIHVQLTHEEKTEITEDPIGLGQFSDKFWIHLNQLKAYSKWEEPKKKRNLSTGTLISYTFIE